MGRQQHDPKELLAYRIWISIGGRPATAEDRAIPSHWEGDLLKPLEGWLGCDRGASALQRRFPRGHRNRLNHH
ncbi:hypothetical protein DBB29_02910 [Pandoraea cepalis]|uniref:Transposase n=1 Tax=Pandoraea cepalis TaxID=2508294 RepID=A0AAW7MJ64_9BURK|nr:hypothetical protein [Pandoraea cepalis]MDN4577070.1 hypothetical protein [Pandoraea cepalis]